MVFVDFSSPAAQAAFRAWLRYHEAQLRAIADALPELASTALESAERARDARPLGLVLDIDETVLCNIHMNEYTPPTGSEGAPFRVADFFDFKGAPGGEWRWADKACGSGDDISPPYPGAAELVATARKLGLALFYVSGRRERLRPETAENLWLAGLDPGEAFDMPPGLRCGRCGSNRERVPSLYLLPDDYDLSSEGEARGSIRPFKESCRERIERTHRIVATVGDQLSDFGAHCGGRQILLSHSFYFTP